MQVRIIGGEKLVAPVAQALTEQGAAVTTTADFSGTLAPETTLVWLPNPLDPVGDLVADLVAFSRSVAGAEADRDARGPRHRG